VILGCYAGKSHNLIGLGIFHGDLDFFDLHEKSLDLSNYDIFPQKILKSRTFKKSSILIVKRVCCLNRSEVKDEKVGTINSKKGRNMLEYCT
jgi:hypothetical protein